NAFAPINTFPPELLTMIFSFAVDVDPHRQHVLGSVTHVCKNWRDICMKTPSLWAHSLGRLPRALPVFLERA
ncbi:hypothetical protein PENSPDRAFT_556012, partial [Peniophora sp. CONT]